MRALLAVTLFAAVAALVAVAKPSVTAAQDKKDEKKAQPKFDPPKATKPDEATLKTIAEKTEQLRKAIASLKEKKISLDVLIEVEIYLKAAENIVRFEEWYAAASGKWALTTLDQGLARAKQAEGGKAVWRDAPGGSNLLIGGRYEEVPITTQNFSKRKVEDVSSSVVHPNRLSSQLVVFGEDFITHR